MNNGYIQQIGTPSELYDNPANAFVGGFIGSPAMNSVRGMISGNRFVNSDITIDIPENKMQVLKEKNAQNVIFGIRPEAFEIAYNGSAKVKGKVDVVEYLGSEYIVTFSMGSETLYTAKLDAATVKDDIRDNISLSLNMDKTYFFDAETEQRLV